LACPSLVPSLDPLTFWFRFFDFVIILRPITMYQDYLNYPWPLFVRISPACPSLMSSRLVLVHLHSESATTVTDRQTK
jgi:hypothetical protein